MQLDQLRRRSGERGWNVAGEFVDHGVSGAKFQRPQLARLLELVNRHGCDIVIVWKLDRLGRSLIDLVQILEHFRQQQVEFVSLTDQIDTTTAGGKLHFHILAAFAQFERDLISERTTAALDLARRKGIRLGRPRLNVDRAAIYRDWQRGASFRKLAREYRISKTQAQAICIALDRRKGDR